MGKALNIVNPDLEKKERKELSLREILVQAKANRKSGKGLGHVGYATRLLRRLKEEVGPEEFGALGPGVAFAVICAAMEKEKPELFKKVKEEVGLKRYRMECSVQYYKVKDEK